MSAATDYLDSILGPKVTKKDGTTTYKGLVDMFKDDGGAKGYLDKLLTSQTKSDTTTAAPTTAAPTGQIDLTNIDTVATMAQQGGWADPKNFSVDMLDMGEFGPGSVKRGGSTGGSDGGGVDMPTFVKFKDPSSRGITDTGRNLNRVEVLQDKKVFADTETSTDQDFTVTPGGYKVLAGAVPGTKQHTALYYQYDKDGKFMGANFDQEESFAQGIAPLVGMAGMAFGLGGGAAALGASANSALNLGLAAGGVGEAALGGAIFGGGSSALTGQNVVKGTLTGAASAGIGAYNPATTLMGITNPTLVGGVNGALSSGAGALINNGDVGTAMLAGGLQGAATGATAKKPGSTSKRFPTNYWLPPANNRA